MQAAGSPASIIGGAVSEGQLVKARCCGWVKACGCMLGARSERPEQTSKRLVVIGAPLTRLQPMPYTRPTSSGGMAMRELRAACSAEGC